jgi:hypothetical protein
MCYLSLKQLWFTYVGLRKYKLSFKPAEVEVKKAFQEFFNLLLCPQNVSCRSFKAAIGICTVFVHSLVIVSNNKMEILTSVSRFHEK